MIEYAVIGLAVVLALAALGAVLALLLSFRTPRPFEPAIPNFVPDDWGGDRTTAKPERRAAIKRG